MAETITPIAITSRPALRVLLAVFGLLLTAWVMSWQVRWLAGELYLHTSNQAADAGLDATELAEALALTAKIIPWNAGVWGRLADNLVIRGRRAPAENAMRQALQLAPLDADLWIDAARLRFAYAPTDPDVARDVLHALTLWPRNPALQYRLAWWGIESWVYGDAVLQAIWRRQIFGLPPELFNRLQLAIFGTGRETLYCQALVEHPEKDSWCQGVVWLRHNCGLVTLPEAARNWCKLYGL